MSEPRYAMKVTRDVYVTMRDGVRIALCIYRPDAEGRFPTLFATSPYQYDFDHVPALPLFLWRETGPIEWYVAHGYAYVHADARGSGRSEGVFGFLDRTEQGDNYELIEWIARQPWSNGKVGGFGQSYYAMAQWFMGIWNPPHLACIVPYDGLTDSYRDSVYHGGIFCGYRSAWYAGLRSNNLHRPVNAPTGRAMEFDLGYEILAHQTYDAWWKERSAYERLSEIRVPVFSIGHWGKLGLHLRGNLLGFEEVKTSKKLLVTGARDVYEAHHLFDQIDFHEKELLRFYDHFLKGMDNGVMEGAPVRIWVRGEERYREETEWPLSRARYVTYHLRKGPSGSVTSLNDGRLSATPPAQDESPTAYAYPDPQWKIGVVAIGAAGPDPVRRVLTFTSPQLGEDLEVTGPVCLELWASSDQIDTEFIVKLSDQHPLSEAEREKGAQPTFVNVSKGWLRASHREKDESRSTPHRPFYTHQNPRPLEPGKPYEFEIEILPTSYLFRKGHRIRLELANGDSPLTDNIFSHPYLPWKLGKDTIYHDADHPSRILLPVIARERNVVSVNLLGPP